MRLRSLIDVAPSPWMKTRDATFSVTDLNSLIGVCLSSGAHSLRSWHLCEGQNAKRHKAERHGWVSSFPSKTFLLSSKLKGLPCGLACRPSQKTYIAFLQVAVEAYKDLFDREKSMKRAIQDSLLSSHMINNLCIHEQWRD